MQNDNKEWAVLIKCKAFELTPERIAAEWNTQAIINQFTTRRLTQQNNSGNR